MASASTDSHEAQHRERFVDVETNPHRKLMPIQGYADKPLVSLEEAIEPLVTILHDIQRMASYAKWRCGEQSSDGLTLDQSASIMLYTMEWEPQSRCLFFVLNATLRDENRQKLKPWFLYLKLFLTALSHLPPQSGTVFRGVRSDLRDQYKKGETITWWGFSSCTQTMDVLETDQFFGTTGSRTIFTIECVSGRQIKNHSAFPHEEEILLPAARQFQVASCLRQGSELCMIHLKEVIAPVPLIDLVAERRSIENGIQPKLANNWKATPPYPARWNAQGITVAGGQGSGANLNQLNRPCGIFIDEKQTLFIADSGNDRIVVWELGATSGTIIAGGQGRGNRLNQLNRPTDIVVDQSTNSLIICDRGNRRVVSWPRRYGSSKLSRQEGKVLVENIDCSGLTIDHHGRLYLTDAETHEVRCYADNNASFTIVAGGHGRGNRLDQLHDPTNIFVDEHCSVYVSDMRNHRVMKWIKDASEGIVVAGTNRKDGNLDYLTSPRGIWADPCGHLYVADQSNHRVVRWEKGANEAKLIIGGYGAGMKANQLNGPNSIFFDRHGHLYLSDWMNDRIQRFTLNNN